MNVLEPNTAIMAILTPALSSTLLDIVFPPVRYCVSGFIAYSYNIGIYGDKSSD